MRCRGDRRHPARQVGRSSHLRQRSADQRTGRNKCSRCSTRTSMTSAHNLAESSHIAVLVATTIASRPSSEPSVHRVSITQVRQTISRSSVDRRRAACRLFYRRGTNRSGRSNEQRKLGYWQRLTAPSEIFEQPVHYGPRRLYGVHFSRVGDPCLSCLRAPRMRHDPLQICLTDLKIFSERQPNALRRAAWLGKK